MPIGNRGLYGQPVLPYVDAKAYAGGDVFVDLTFLDHTNTPFTPSSFTYQLDDLTNVKNMIPSTLVNTGITGSTYTLRLPASSLAMTNNLIGSQLCQLYVVATDSNGYEYPGVCVIELCAIQVPP